MLEIKQRCLEHHFPEIKFFKNDMCLQGRTKWRNCRLTRKTPDYQLGWTVWATSRLLDTLKQNFCFMQ